MTNGVTSELFIGLMSGTSMDGVDGVLARFIQADHATSGAPGDTRVDVLAHSHHAFPADLAEELFALNTPGGSDELHRASLAANALAGVYTLAVQRLLQIARLSAKDVRAVGAHGQTVRHRPGAFDGVGYTLQLNQPALLAESCGIDVVADFRSRDLAAGGQAAPLVPAFHRAVFGGAGEDIAVLNIGGISNFSLLFADGRCLGFDCGPGNALMDHWCKLHTGAPYDDAGGWAAGGRVIDSLLAKLLAEPYFAQPAPKSTGRDLFNPAWLQRMLSSADPTGTARAQDVQATLAALTARTCAQSLLQHQPQAQAVQVCGGGAYNRHLMALLSAELPNQRVLSTAASGLPVDQVEAAAFAWLARAHCHRTPGNLPSVTGASGTRILGALYPA